MSRDTQIEELKQAVAKGRVVAVAGTGVSVATCGDQDIDGFKVGTWLGLLQHGVMRLREDKRMAAEEAVLGVLEAQIATRNTGQMIQAAETISQHMEDMGKGVFRKWLKDTIGKLTLRDRTVADALGALPCVLATLNYDGLLEKATGRHPVTWLEADQVQDALHDDDTEAILHLHGWFKEPESVVFGLRSYIKVKDHPHAQAVWNAFAVGGWTLLLVGCGDTVRDPNFTRLINWGKVALEDVAPCHYLLCRTSQVAAFQKDLSSAPWLQPLAYGDDYKDLAPFLRSLAPVPVGGSGAPFREPIRPNIDFTAYQQAMRNRYARLKLEALVDPGTHNTRPLTLPRSARARSKLPPPSTHDTQSLTLTKVFIAQSAREFAAFMPHILNLPKELQRRLRAQGDMEDSDLDEELLEQHRRAYRGQTPRPILEIVRDPDCRLLVILGDPGSGKSTLLQYLLLDWAEKAGPDFTSEPLPLLIELRGYARSRDKDGVKDFLDYLHAGADVRWHLDRTQLDAWLKQNPSCLLFDGLDEVFDPDQRHEISTSIHRFADEYPLARIIVTSRIVGYRHEVWRDEPFRHFRLEELDEEQVADFLNRWHRVAYEKAAEGERKCARLVDAIQNSVAIRQLAGNPLLLTMMAILNRTQDLPRKRAELYEQCARLLLNQWKADAAFVPYPERANARLLDYKAKHDLLLGVARAMQSSEGGLAGNWIDEGALERALADGLRGRPDLERMALT